MTKFSTLDRKKKEVKKTTFRYYINENLEIGASRTTPESWDNVLHIGYDRVYGDVFKVWSDHHEEDTFIIMFGEKGDEFDN